MTENKDKGAGNIFHNLSLSLKPNNEDTPVQPQPELTPAMPELGTAPCPVCGHRVAVFVTRTKRPFINCGHCSVRIFYNGSRSMNLLKEQIEALTQSEPKLVSKATNGLKSIVGGKK